MIPGIGPKTVASLESDGYPHPGRPARRASEPELEASFGPRSGAWLHASGQLRDETPVVAVHETKSQSTEITFDVDVGDRPSSSRHLAELSEELCRRLRKRELEGRTIGIKVRLDDWTNVTRSHTVEQPTNDPAVVGPVALDLLRAYDPPRPVRLLGVRVASFEHEEAEAEEEPADDESQMQLTLPH